jgi:Zn-dependent membrane protease YugP
LAVFFIGYSNIGEVESNQSGGIMYPFLFGGFNMMYLLFSLPALLFGLWAQAKVKNTFNKYSKIRTYTGASGGQVARHILDENGLQDVRVEPTSGVLSDNYDPRTRTLRLSAEVYQGNSLASAGVAAHEAGHALQHQAHYGPLQVRSLMVPTVMIGSWLGPIIFMLGLFMSSATGDTIAWIGLVELDATKRAKLWLVSSGSLVESELPGAAAVLDAAAWTYVAAAIQAVTTILYYAFLLLGRPRRQ